MPGVFLRFGLKPSYEYKKAAASNIRRIDLFYAGELKGLVPPVRLELTHLSVLDFESNGNFFKLLYFIA
jgi:hypothetical protein